MFAALGVELVALRYLARAQSLERVQDALWMFRLNRILGPVSSLTLLGSGLYLGATVWSGHPPWIGTGLVAFLLIAVLGGALAGRNIVRLERAVRRDLEAGATQPPPLPLTALRVSLGARLGLLLGVTFAMVVKPELAGCLIAELGGLGLGVLAALLGRPPRTAAVPARA